MSPIARVAAVLLLAALVLPAALAACPLCKDATPDAESPGGSASLGRGFFYSILLMIAVPWTAVATVAFLIFRRRRRDRGAEPPGGVAFLPESHGVES
jgi:heme/copper-type cytochrome/quinol oxidase subunit 2